MKIYDLRKDYEYTPLSKQHLAPNPLIQFEKWFKEALSIYKEDANVMSLATADKCGTPSCRAVLLKDYSPRGFVFFTNYKSAKAQQIAENSHAALLFVWMENYRQIRIEGTVKKTTRKESEAYFKTRPRESQIATWASSQSSTILSRKAIDAQVEDCAKKFSGQPIPCPPFWGGYCVSPCLYEFWQGQNSRLHDRFLYEKKTRNKWSISRLQP